MPPMVGFLRRRRDDNHFEGPQVTWESSHSDVRGYADPHLLDKVLAATLAVRDGDGAFERDSVVMHEPEIHWPLATALGLARGAGPIRVLDFGGSLGSLYFQHLELLEVLGLGEWLVVEQQHFVDVGKEHLGSATLTFSADLAGSLKRMKPNLALFSSVLQYVKNYQQSLQAVLDCQVPVISIDRTFLTHKPSGSMWIQRVPKSIYSAQYACWQIPVTALSSMLTDAGYTILAEYENMMFPALNRRNGFYGGFLAVSKEFHDSGAKDPDD